MATPAARRMKGRPAPDHQSRSASERATPNQGGVSPAMITNAPRARGGCGARAPRGARMKKSPSAILRAAIAWRRPGVISERPNAMIGSGAATAIAQATTTSTPMTRPSSRMAAPSGAIQREAGGEGGIRTLDTLTGITVFETARFHHSRTSPPACLHEGAGWRKRGGEDWLHSWGYWMPPFGHLSAMTLARFGPVTLKRLRMRSVRLATGDLFMRRDASEAPGWQSPVGESPERPRAHEPPVRRVVRCPLPPARARKRPRLT